MPRASFTSSVVDFGAAAVSISWNLRVELPQLSTRIFTMLMIAPIRIYRKYVGRLQQAYILLFKTQRVRLFLWN
jgi:hypothetical protein